MIENLTPQQEEQIPIYRNKYIDIGLDTTPINFNAVKEQLHKIYSILKLPQPPVFGPFASPVEANRAIAYARTDPNLTNDDLVSFAHDTTKKIDIENNQFFTGQHEAFWVSFYAFFQEVVGISYEDKEALFNEVKKLVSMSGWMCLFEFAAFVVERPSVVKVLNGQRHCVDGPAIAFNSKFFPPIYALKGINVTKDIIEGNFTWKDIENQSNAEVRRTMIEKYGKDRYIVDSGLKPIHQDDWGTLYEKTFPNDPEPLRVVKVVNSTPELDGSYKDYFHRVDPKAYDGAKIAWAAVASLWRNKDGSLRFKNYRDYHPLMES